jgi:hypothetical protein
MKWTEDKFNIIISFEGRDWGSGMARAMIDAIKSLPYGHRKYNADRKDWTIVNDKNYKERLMAVRNSFKKDEYGDFDVDKWWHEIEEKNGQADNTGTEIRTGAGSQIST